MQRLESLCPQEQKELLLPPPPVVRLLHFPILSRFLLEKYLCFDYLPHSNSLLLLEYCYHQTRSEYRQRPFFIY